MFNWENLPVEEIPEFKRLVEGNYKKKLKEMHDKYNLSTWRYDGCCELGKLLNRCYDAIQRGIIQ